MKSVHQIAEQEGSIEEFLRKRTEIEQTIRQKFQRKITVMFTDISSSTEFYEIHGDLEGRSMIQRHNDLLGPIIEKNGGKVLRTLGDGLMAIFESPPDAARAATEIQSTLAEENRGQNPSEQIWIKAAIHHGLGIVEKGDVYGDMINTVARICALAKKGDVLVSQSYVDLIRDDPEISYEYVGIKNLKGKSAPIDIYRLIWDPAQMEDLRRSTESEQPQLNSSEWTLRLHFSLQGDRLRLAVFPTNSKQTQILKQVREFPYREAEIRNLVEDFDQCLMAVDGRGRLPEAKLLRMKELGRTLYEMLIPEDVGKFISETRVPHLALQIDDTLVYIPWELLHNGEEFLSISHSIGRIVSSSQKPLARSRNLDRRPLKILLIADPKGNLPASKTEGISIQKELNRSGSPNTLSADLYSQEVSAEFLRSRLKDYELLHYAGHFDYVPDDPSQSGLLLADGKFEVGRFLGLARDFSLPSLVFSNACQSGRTGTWSTGERLYSFANALLTAGVRHYIGGTSDLFDRLSAAFAEGFYRQLVANQAIGEAVRQARIKSIRRFGEENLAWASYVLYGDPSFRYFGVDALPAKESRYEARSLRKVFFAVVGVLLLAVVGFGLGHLWSEGAARERLARDAFNLIHVGQLTKAEEIFTTLEGKSPLSSQGMSAVYLNRGNLEKAEQNLSLAQQQEAGAPYVGVIKAHLALNRGQLDEAETGYRKALGAQGLENWQQAESHYGLGKIRLARGETSQAIEEFDQALRLDPSFMQAHTAKGSALERQGKPQDALDFYQKAAGINPADPINAVLYRKCRESVDYRESGERQERVDQLVSDLLKAYREGPVPAGARDEWSSRPLYLFFTNLETKGQSAPREGEDAYINELLSRDLGNIGRIRALERGLLDRLLEELKLSSSQLADPQAALRLGKILSARLLVTGSLLRYKGQLQINLRAIDTENTRVVATASGTCQLSEDPATVSSSLARELQDRILSAYPIRGRIAEIRPGETTLNVGSAVGVVPGMKFHLMEKNEKGVELTVSTVAEMTSRAALNNEVEMEPSWRVEELL
jgi:class 3 adenylate cyclase/tetratricopeptide (TPR) repeat protein